MTDTVVVPLLVAAFFALAVVIAAVVVPSLLNLASRKPDMPDDGRRQAEHDLEAWRQQGRVRIVEPKEPKP